MVNDLLPLGLKEADIRVLVEDAAAAGVDPSSLKVWWREPAALQTMCDQMGFATVIHEVFATAAARIDRETPAWWTLLALCAPLMISEDAAVRKRLLQMPAPPSDRWGELSALHRALIYLTALPGMVEHHRTMGIDPQITRDTADDLPLWMHEYHQKHGRWGTADVGWFQNHLRCRIFALGRLQFDLSQFGLKYTILVNKKGESAALVLGGELIRTDGQFAGADDGLLANAPDNWTTTYSESTDGWAGHRVDPKGFIRRELETFPAEDWQVHTRQFDRSIGVHIPARGRLETQACLDAFTKAEAFFTRYFPDYQNKLFQCVSWLMDPQLTLLENGQSNLGRFVQLFQSVPLSKGNSHQMFERVFNNQTDLATLPRDNTLRRTLIHEMQQGRRYRSAGGYRLWQTPPTR